MKLPAAIRVILVALLYSLSLSEAPAQSLREVREKAKPGSHHERLKRLVGRWNIRIEYRLHPTANPERATGTAEFRWILGGRFLEQVLDGRGTASSYDGRGLIGFDNALGRYVGTWVDSASSGIAYSTGTVDRAGTTWQLEMSATDVSSGRTKTHPVTLTIVSDNELRYIIYPAGSRPGVGVPPVNITYLRQ